MKLKYLALTASLCAAFFAACDDSGVAPKEHIAAYDTLPRFCEESDTVRLSSTGNLFYCNNGDWLEVGVIINKPKSSSSADKPKSSDDTEIESSDDENIVESAESGKSSSSRGRGKSSNSSGTNSVSSSEETESNSSTEGSGSSGTESGSSVEDNPYRDPAFNFLDDIVTWGEFGNSINTADYNLLETALETNNFSSVIMDTYDDDQINRFKTWTGIDCSPSSGCILFVNETESSAGEKTSYYVTYLAGTIVAGIRSGSISKIVGYVSDDEILCGNLWCAPDGVYRVTTGLDKGTNTSGYWFDITDNSFGGESYFTWPVPRGNEYTDDAFDPIIDHCRGICGIATLDHGELAFNAYVGLGFNIAGETSATDMTPAAADASAWDGICVVYSSTTNMTVEMSLGEYGDRDLAFDLPYAVLPRGTNMVTNLSWEDFDQAGWGKDKGAAVITGPEAAEQLVSLTFKIQATDGDYNFNLISVGKYGTCE
jgi:hypothetical protein